MTYSVTFLTREGWSRTEHIVADTSFLAVQTAQLLDDVTRITSIAPLARLSHD